MPLEKIDKMIDHKLEQIDKIVQWKPKFRVCTFVFFLVFLLLFSLSQISCFEVSYQVCMFVDLVGILLEDPFPVTK